MTTETFNVAFKLGSILNQPRDEKEVTSQTIEQFDDMCDMSFVKRLREVVELTDMNDKQGNRLFFLISTSEEILAYGNVDTYIHMIENMLDTYGITHENHVLHIKKVISWFGQGNVAARQMAKFDASKMTNEDKKTFSDAYKYAEKIGEATPEYTRLISLLTN